MAPTGYWSLVSKSRLSRRRLLAGSSATAAGLAALSLVGCGGGDSGSLVRQGDGLLATTEDTTARAKPGGTLLDQRTSDYTTFDPLTANNLFLSSRSQSRLTMGTPTRFARYDGAIQGDLADSWETSDDGLQWTFKLRTNAVFPDLPGGKKRNVDAQDIIFTYNRYLPLGEYRSALSNALGPGAPIVSVQAPDARTVVMKLAFPFAPLLPGLLQEHLWIYPREAESEYDPRTKMLGSGPWVIEDYTQSSHIHYKRNAEWHHKGRPFVDKVQQAILPDYGARLAQFRAHRIHFGVVRQEEILQTKKDLPQLNLVNLGLRPVGYPIWVFGMRPGSPFRDERVRQAFSMSLDRDTLIDVFSNVSNYRKEGLTVATRTFTHMGLSPDKFWLDPNGKDFGASAKYLKFDPIEAKKLVAAAGLGSGTKTQFSHTGALSNIFLAAHDMVRQNLGWEIEDKVLTPTNTYLDMKGDFDGITNSTYSERADPGVYLYHKYHSDGSSKRVPAGIDPQMDKILNDQFRITDDKKRTELLHEFQRYMAQKMWTLPLPGKGDIFDLAWPELKNYGVYNDSIPEIDATELMGLYYWLDQTPA